MNIDLTVTGKETDVEVAKKVAKALETFQANINTSNADAAESTMIAYYMLSLGLISSYFLNKAANTVSAHTNQGPDNLDKKLVMEHISSVEIPHLIEDVAKQVEYFLSMIGTPGASVTEIRK